MLRDPKKIVEDLSEKGAAVDGIQQTSERRLFMQFLAFDGCRDSAILIKSLEGSGFGAVLYADINDRYGIGLLTWSEDPDFFVGDFRSFLKEGPFADLTRKDEYSMLGRTYSLGHERSLDDWLIDRSPRTVCNPEWPWAVWYPLKRSGRFALLEPKEQGAILMEHGVIGRAFGEADLGHDIRLATHGLDKNDNDFIIGLIGKDLFPLSALVQTMRGTKQTSSYIDSMGPFF
ncbi:MAG: chlorite dismutase family protein, partial [Thermodesulfobacteriota bacterium]